VFLAGVVRCYCYLCLEWQTIAKWCVLGYVHLTAKDRNLVFRILLDYENLENQGVPLSRVSQCSCQPNNYGFKLLNLCKKLNIYIFIKRFWIRIFRTFWRYINTTKDNIILSVKCYIGYVYPEYLSVAVNQITMGLNY
jgi:hypothetical protein